MDTRTRPPKLMDRVKATMRVKRYSPRTEKTYCYWIRYFIRFHGVRHPASMGSSEVRAFLEYLAVERQVAAATQNQALNAIAFLYRHVLEQPLGEIGEFSRAKRPRRLPVGLSHEEVMGVLSQGTDIRTVQELLGHKSVETTQIYKHVWARALPACVALREKERLGVQARYRQGMPFTGPLHDGYRPPACLHRTMLKSDPKH
ncbi:phage integrase N-terminal SAM-like domain-containing protein [Halomonas faecis]|uniref:phage integrase N-terminal SAM-like domain-containing protein n=1 Tax=Halomonas faecis TaxID=1562110 RepID=UPI0013D807B5|nr:phage integrase N-terminal SAM-like domain-containing protein [Halomonas faecis]